MCNIYFSFCIKTKEKVNLDVLQAVTRQYSEIFFKKKKKASKNQTDVSVMNVGLDVQQTDVSFPLLMLAAHSIFSLLIQQKLS